MRKPHSSNWILVAGFLVIGLLNLAFNPFAIQATRASNDDCDGDPPCCLNGDVEADCVDEEWVCPLV